MSALREGMRILSFVVALLVLSWNQSQAKPCSEQPQAVNGPQILSTTTYYARPGQENSIYQGLVQENQLLKKHGLEGFTVLRGPGGTGPAAEWEMTFATMAAHDVWYKESNKALPAVDPFWSSVLRAEHRHYKFLNGWTFPNCK